MSMTPEQLLPHVRALAREAGHAILTIYQQSEAIEVTCKADKSPVTIADLTAHHLIKAGLQKLTPNYPVLSEEDMIPAYEIRRQWTRYWLVDPLDGTKEFIARNGEFTVNIALIENQQPILGVINEPVAGQTYYATATDGAFKETSAGVVQAIHTRACEIPLAVIVSRRHGTGQLNQLLSKLPAYQLQHAGSSLKSCIVAEGQADLHPRFGPTSEWDTAAAQCIVFAAGGAMLDFYLQPLRYNERESLINPAFIVVGDCHYPWSDML